ncbi:DUF523 domain-containing protein [Flavobacterium litorale]|uniref:DUF523 domain-containing protein n=1 Tax=Flavobacterium litorale TaxID=2856519 RepID=A0ABX8V4K3_9FLAO|nr:DUF523 domain-containing protein [Flavobacterium litorale]QYJ67747.1 DUF523 domain-containing protein [Flavobacterium litorale]
MTDKDYLKNLRIPTKENPLRVLSSACLLGQLCGVDGTSNGTYPSVLKLVNYENIKLIPFCPEDFVFGTPRETPDIEGGNGHDVLEGKAKVITETGKDITAKMITASLKMLEIAQQNNVELAILMDVSGACGSQVIYNGSRFSENPIYQIGMGVCAAQLDKHGIKIISQRDYKSLEILYSKIDKNHIIQNDVIDHDEHEWYLDYFKNH